MRRPPRADRRAFLAGVVAVLIAATRAYAQTGQTEVAEAWSRATSSGAPTAGGYLVVHNRGGADDRLVSASSPLARAVEMHSSNVDANGVMRMRPIEGGLVVPSGGELRLTPDGGRHLMLIAPTRAFQGGERLPLVLTFEKAGPVEVSLVVEAPGARGPAAGHAGHGAHGSAPR
jgi:copper(I)-binding protein